MTKAEQETIVRWDREASEVSVFSADPKVWRRMARFGIAPRRETQEPNGKPAGKFYRAPVGWLRWSVRGPSAGKRRGNPAALQRARARKAVPA